MRVCDNTREDTLKLIVNVMQMIAVWLESNRYSSKESIASLLACVRLPIKRLQEQARFTTNCRVNAAASAGKSVAWQSCIVLAASASTSHLNSEAHL